jgi:quercetin dioxygenase-like cupin family protein
MVNNSPEMSEAGMRHPELTDEIGTTLLYDSPDVSVWLIDLSPGEASAWHRHEYPYRYTITSFPPGVVRVEFIDGTHEMQDGESLSSTHFRHPDPGHRLVNIGELPYQNVVVEFKAGQEESTQEPS